MKWDQYKLLTREEREEYTFRFKSKLDNTPRMSLIWVVLIWSNFVSLMCVYLVILKEYIQVSIMPLELLSYLGNVTWILLVGFLLDLVGNWVIYFYWDWKARKWYKEKVGLRL